MVRLAVIILVTTAGAAVGGIIGLVAGAAFLETGRTACTGAACADIVVRSFAPAGAILGALAGFSKARSLRKGRA